VNAASELGSFQARLGRGLEKAKARKEAAEQSCREPDARRTKKLLKKAVRKAISFVRTLRSRRARKSLPQALRDELVQAADGVRVDLQALRSGVQCPDDARQ
jgi:hypothetical protein